MTSICPLLEGNLTHFQLIPLTKYFWITVSHYTGWFLFNLVLSEHFNEDNQMSCFHLISSTTLKPRFWNTFSKSFSSQEIVRLIFFLPFWNKFIISKFTITQEVALGKKKPNQKTEKKLPSIFYVLSYNVLKNHVFLSHMHMWMLCIYQNWESDLNSSAKYAEPMWIIQREHLPISCKN